MRHAIRAVDEAPVTRSRPVRVPVVEPPALFDDLELRFSGLQDGAASHVRLVCCSSIVWFTYGRPVFTRPPGATLVRRCRLFCPNAMGSVADGRAVQMKPQPADDSRKEFFNHAGRHCDGQLRLVLGGHFCAMDDAVSLLANCQHLIPQLYSTHNAVFGARVDSSKRSKQVKHRLGR